MVFHVVAVGRVAHAGLRTACDDFAGRIRRHVKLEIHEVPEGGRRAKRDQDVQRVEADALLRAGAASGHRVAISRVGDPLGSREFAGRLGRWREAARDVNFVIGGASGLHETITDRCSEAIRLSRMTFPHELARLVLLEQIYRGLTILHGSPYHKGD